MQKLIDFRGVKDIKLLFEKIENIGAMDRYIPYDDNRIEEIELEMRAESKEVKAKIKAENGIIESGFISKYSVSKSDAQTMRRLARGGSNAKFKYQKIEVFEDRTMKQFLESIERDLSEFLANHYTL